MSAILPSIRIDSTALLAKYFTPYQAVWIQADDFIRTQNRAAFALAEKSVRIGWTYADAFKNVRKRLRFSNRDYLFVTKDYPSALEYMHLAYRFIEFFSLTRSVLAHGEDCLDVHQIDPDGKPTPVTEQIKIGYIKFDSGSRIIAFSSSPYAMAVYGGDVGLDEFAKHPNAKLLWQTAQARVTWNYDLAVWSSHDGEDTLFNQFAREARNCSSINPLIHQSTNPTSVTPSLHLSTTPSPPSPWNLYFRVTMPEAIELGLLDLINRTQGTTVTADQFLADCRTRAGSEEIFQQSYMCNPLGAATASIVEWSAIERCRYDYEIQRVHLEADQVLRQFGEFNPRTEADREETIEQFTRTSFRNLFDSRSDDSRLAAPKRSEGGSNAPRFRLGFDVAASGQGDLAAFYIDEPDGDILWLRGLLTARTEDWHFLKTVLFYFLRNLRHVQAAGDESGLGRQICWEASSKFPGRFMKVNFASKKHDLAFALMNQLSVAEKRFPRSQQDIAADYFALRKVFTGTRWVFTQGHNIFNPVSHCDIAWAGALATHAHTQRRFSAGGLVA